jgi:hypothetical protein
MHACAAANRHRAAAAIAVLSRHDTAPQIRDHSRARVIQPNIIACDRVVHTRQIQAIRIVATDNLLLVAVSDAIRIRADQGIEGARRGQDAEIIGMAALPDPFSPTGVSAFYGIRPVASETATRPTHKCQSAA